MFAQLMFELQTSAFETKVQNRLPLSVARIRHYVIAVEIGSRMQ